MKKIVLLMVLSPFIALAQMDAKKMEEFKKRVQTVREGVGKITFTFNKITYTDKAMMDKHTKKGFVIASHMMYDDTPDTNFSFVVPQKKSGSYKLDGNQAGIVLLNKKTYAFKGTIVLKIVGNKTMGTLEGELYEIPKGKPNPSTQSSGKVTGSFSS